MGGQGDVAGGEEASRRWFVTELASASLISTTGCSVMWEFSERPRGTTSQKGPLREREENSFIHRFSLILAFQWYKFASLGVNFLHHLALLPGSCGGHKKQMASPVSVQVLARDISVCPQPVAFCAL